MIKYYVDEPKRTVVAVLDECELDAINLINKKIGYLNFFDESRYVLPKRFVGVAKCDPRDIFNVDEGKKIAKKKCLDKYHKTLHKTTDKFCTNMMRKIDRIYSALASDNLLYGCEE